MILGKESNVHKTPFYNGQILERLSAEIIGFRVQLKQQRVFLNRFGQRIYEDLLHLSPGTKKSMEREQLIAEARSLGREVLMEALDRVPKDRRCYLEEAINRASQVDPSPILDPLKARKSL